jgi:DNA-binding LacI/PurR family transcriptional regulator
MASQSRPTTAGRSIMHDVARLAGVSHQTVSRVINHQPNVSETTRQKVLDAMRRLNYRPNALARGLVTRRSRTVGVLGFDTELHGPSSTLLGVQRAAQQARYGVIVATLSETDDQAAVRQAVGGLVERFVEGILVIAPSKTSARAMRDLSNEIPAVALEASFSDDLPVVMVDQVGGATLATQHLVDLGHTTVWHVAGPDDWSEARQRITGWQQILATAGLHAPTPLRGDWSPESGHAAGLQIAQSRDVTAVFSANDQMALGILHALHSRGIRVPEDVSIVGFDDMPESAYFYPALTTVRQDFDEVGRTALRRLIAVLDNEDVDVPLKIQPKLIVRASTAPPTHSARIIPPSTGIAQPLR